MEMEPGKVFIGGISWETSEERLKEYFGTFGEVVEAVIMKDRATGRGRGFGFIVFAYASVAKMVVKERHAIDGRTVEAKKAVPRDDHQNFNRNNSGSPRPARTKKIFVGGLPSSLTETDFKTYFDQFGTITDVVVMYDHNTQRPRGFGFITYDSEEAVDKLLFKTFHELNGKMVEVKRALPKELSPTPTRNQSSVYNYGLNRGSSFLNSYSPGHNSGSPSMRMDGRFSPVAVGRNGYPPYSPFSYSTGLKSDSRFGLNGDSGSGCRRVMNSYYSGNTGHFGSPIRYDGGVNGNGRMLNPNFWRNGNGTNSMASESLLGGTTSGLGSIGEFWGSSPIRGSDNFGGGARNHGSTTSSWYSFPNNILYESYEDRVWQSSSPEHNDVSGYELVAGADATADDSVGGYSVVNGRSNTDTGKDLEFISILGI